MSCWHLPSYDVRGSFCWEVEKNLQFAGEIYSMWCFLSCYTAVVISSLKIHAAALLWGRSIKMFLSIELRCHISKLFMYFPGQKLEWHLQLKALRRACAALANLWFRLLPSFFYFDLLDFKTHFLFTHIIIFELCVLHNAACSLVVYTMFTGGWKKCKHSNDSW